MIVDVGDQNVQNRHQHLIIVINTLRHQYRCNPLRSPSLIVLNHIFYFLGLTFFNPNFTGFQNQLINDMNLDMPTLTVLNEFNRIST